MKRWRNRFGHLFTRAPSNMYKSFPILASSFGPALGTRPKREEIILHIGSHKTGTSAIQYFLQKNQQTLAKRLDLAVATLHPWPLRFDAEDARMHFDTEGLNILQSTRARRALLTHECYSWLYRKEDLAALHATLTAHAERVRVVLYVRRQDAMAVSMKQEGTKWIDCATAFGHEPTALPSSLTPLAESYLRYDERVRLWASIFGKENLVIRVFERSQLKNGDAIEDFMDILGESDLSSYLPVGKRNASLTRTQQLFLHQTRGQFAEHTPAKQLLVQMVRSMDLGDSQKLLPSKAQALAFYEQFREGNAWLNREFQLSEHECLFSEDFSGYPDHADDGPLSQEELIAIFQKVMSEVALRLEGFKPDNQVEGLADWLRELAIEREKSDSELALLLMQKAHQLKPRGPFIKKKIAGYWRSLRGS